MELRHYASLLWKWAWLIGLGTFLAAATSYIVSTTMPKVYEASTTLLVNQAQTPGTVAYNDVLTSQQLTKTYGELIHKRPVLETVIADLRLPLTSGDLDKLLSVRVVRDTMLLELKAENTDPQLAAAIANAVTKTFIEENRNAQLGQATQSRDALQAQLQSLERDIKSISAQIDQIRAATDGRTPEARQAEISRLQNTLSQYQLTYSQMLKSDQDMRLAETKALGSVTVAEPASVPAIPVRPKVPQNVLLAALVGLMLAVGMVLLIEYLDDTVKSGEDVARVLGAPALGHIARLKDPEAKMLSSLLGMDPRSAVAEAFRTLRTNLQFSLLDKPSGVILVTSAGPGEGKSTTTANLAQVMAHAGKRVIVVDADLRRPTVHRYFGLKNDVGLTTALLKTGTEGDDILRPTKVPNLFVMTSGPLPPNPSELLGSPRMAALMEALKARADIVLLDCTPCLMVTDATVAAGLADGILMVVDSSSTRSGALAAVRETLERASLSDKLLGAVLNKLGHRSGGYYYGQYYREHGYGPNGDGGNGRRDRYVQAPRDLVKPSGAQKN